MADLIPTLTVVFVAGCIVSLLAWIAAHAVPAIRFWPSFWAVCLLVTIAIPVAGEVIAALAPNVAIGGLSSGADGLIGAVAFDPALFSGPVDGGMDGGAGSVPLGSILATVYALGLGFFLLRLFLGRWRVEKLASAARGPFAINGQLYWASESASAPFAISPLFNRRAVRIVIPDHFAAAMDEQSLALILAHETAHIRHDDDRIGMMLRVLVALSWFSPCAHWLFHEWRDATEVRCDAAALQCQPNEMRRAYAQTLLQALNIMAGRVRQYPAASFSTRRIRSEKMRIREIMNGNSGSFKRAGAVVALGLVASAFTGIAGVAVAASSSESSADVANSFHGRASTTVAASADPDAGQQTPIKIVEGKITSRFGEARDPFNKGKTRKHWGVDIGAPIGTPVYAPSDGDIVEATNLFDNKPNYGIVVIHKSPDGLITLFSHLNGFVVQPGQSVKGGQKIAMVGNTGKSTGPHLHIETIRDGRRIDPLIAWPQLQ